MSLVIVGAGPNLGAAAIGGRIAPGADHDPDDVAEALWRHRTERTGFAGPARHRRALTGTGALPRLTAGGGYIGWPCSARPAVVTVHQGAPKELLPSPAVWPGLVSPA